MEKGAIPLVKGTIVLEFDSTEGRASENGRLVSCCSKVVSVGYGLVIRTSFETSRNLK
jgi:hypothetical protein